MANDQRRNEVSLSVTASGLRSGPTGILVVLPTRQNTSEMGHANGRMVGPTAMGPIVVAVADPIPDQHSNVVATGLALRPITTRHLVAFGLAYDNTA